jgi:pimeloyl-ACP methyl ester carboxylesterase
MSLTMVLSDGRTLSYTESGRRSSSPPIFYIHGWPSSHIEISFWEDAIRKCDAYIVTPDRPGMSLSTFQPSRQILSWPGDILELADHLQIPRFKILAASAGCPFALACAKEIGEDRLIATDVVSGFYPLALETNSMLWSSRIQFFLLKWLPWVVEKGMDFWFAGPALERPALFRERTMQAMAVTSDEDKRCMADEKIAEGMVDTFRESLKLGSKGMTHEGMLLGGSWGFELESLYGKRICLWQGDLDRNCPVSVTHEVVRKVSTLELRVVNKEGHLSLLVNRGEDILKHLIDAGI